MSKAAVATTDPEQRNQAIEHVTAGPGRLMQFLRETRQEMTKVVTPSRSEVRNTTIVVIVTVFLFAAYFEAVDLIFGKAIDQVFLQLTKH